MTKAELTAALVRDAVGGTVAALVSEAQKAPGVGFIVPPALYQGLVPERHVTRHSFAGVVVPVQRSWLLDADDDMLAQVFAKMVEKLAQESGGIGPNDLLEIAASLEASYAEPSAPGMIVNAFQMNQVLFRLTVHHKDDPQIILGTILPMEAVAL